MEDVLITKISRYAIRNTKFVENFHQLIHQSPATLNRVVKPRNWLGAINLMNRLNRINRYSIYAWHGFATFICITACMCHVCTTSFIYSDIENN